MKEDMEMRKAVDALEKEGFWEEWKKKLLYGSSSVGSASLVNSAHVKDKDLQDKVIH